MLLEKKRDHQYLRNAREILFETLWPTACLGCNKPEILLCESCLKCLNYVDLYAACPTCGSPYGRVQCCECNPIMLGAFGLESLPFANCQSAVLFEDVASRLITIYKDRGEQRLAPLIARIMAAYVAPPGLTNLRPFSLALTFIPASAKAYSTRGFDHVHLLAQHLSGLVELPLLDIFERPKAKDQRALTRRARYQNMRGQFIVKQNTPLPRSVLVIDDVFTTGSTMISASETLIAHGVEQVNCLTFARVS